MTTLIKNALLINENNSQIASLLIEDERIKKIFSENENLPHADKIIDATGLWLLPGIIDDQVHFREPGLTQKADIASESAAAVAGGLTSFIEMPNTNPATITNQLLQEKFDIAKNSSYINYSFMLGATNDNIEEIRNINKSEVAGIKMFLGSSTGDLLVDDDEAIENILSSTKSIVAVHCEDNEIINANLKKFEAKYGSNIPSKFHSQIRSEDACYKSSSKAIEIAKKTGGRLHIFHLSTEKELELLSNEPLSQKNITAEVCVHHLWFSDKDYERLGNKIKWNPAVKTEKDRLALIQALKDGKIDVVGSDHAPHLLSEKMQDYTKAPSGGPMVQHTLLVMLELAEQKYFSKEEVVKFTCHNPAELFGIVDRGFVREGYFADLVLVNPNIPTKVEKENLLYKCKWSPLEGETFKHSVQTTFVNGKIVFDKGKLTGAKSAKQLEFKSL